MSPKISNLSYTILLYFHALLSFFLFFGWIIDNRLVLEILFILLIISILLFYLCDGCIITKLERYLSNSNFTVIDPLLTKFNLVLTRKMRTKITLTFFSISLFMSIYKLYLKKN